MIYDIIPKIWALYKPPLPKKRHDHDFTCRIYLSRICSCRCVAVPKIRFGFRLGLFDGGHYDWPDAVTGGQGNRINSAYCRIRRGDDAVLGRFGTRAENAMAAAP